VHDVPGSIGSTDWAYVSGESGSVTFNSLPGGYYYATYFLLNEYAEPGSRAYFTVGDDLAAVTTDKANYTPGENIRVSVQKGPGLINDCIKIFREGEVAPTDSLALNGLTSGVFVYSGTLDTASYYLALFMNGSGHEISNRVYFSVQTNVVSSGSLSVDETLQMYPSPTEGLLHIDLRQSDEHILAIHATTLSGKQVLSQNFEENQWRKSASINISGNSPGIYLIHCITDKSSVTRRVVLF
jgi:hypothetical protein